MKSVLGPTKFQILVNATNGTKFIVILFNGYQYYVIIDFNKQLTGMFIGKIDDVLSFRSVANLKIIRKQTKQLTTLLLLKLTRRYPIRRNLFLNVPFVTNTKFNTLVPHFCGCQKSLW